MPIFTFSSLTGGTANLDLNSAAIAAGDSLKVVGNSIDLVTGGPANLVWGGSIANSGSYNWDTTTSNFLAAGVSSLFKAGDNVTFDDTASNTVVTVSGAGVSPGSVVFSNNAKTYTFQGGPITGGTGLDVKGGGTVIFSNSNTYSGTTRSRKAARCK